MFPIIEIGGQPYLDGGCADGIPWKHALEEGCDRVVVVLTRERDYAKKEGKSGEAIARAFKKYPQFQEAMRTRPERYNRCREELFALEREGKVLVIAPEDTLGCSRTEKNLDTIRALWQEGYFDGRRELERVRKFWTEE